MTDFNEEIVLKGLYNDDSSSFSQLYNHFYDDLCAFVCKFLKSKELSDDICQEVFIKIWNNRKNLDSIQSLRAYIFVIARNLTLNSLKRALVESSAQDEIIHNFRIARSEVDENLQSKEYIAFMESVLTRLPDRSRQVFKFCREQGKTYEETAELLGISRSSVKKHIVRSLKIFKGALHKDFGISFPVALLFIAGL